MYKPEIKIKEYRKERGITQQQLADLVHVSRETIVDWESGKRFPPIDVLDLVAWNLQCTVYDLYPTMSSKHYLQYQIEEQISEAKHEMLMRMIANA